MISLRLALGAAGGSPFSEPSVPHETPDILGIDLNYS